MSLPFFASPHERATLGELARELLMRVSELIQTQLELTRAEIKEEGRKLITAALLGIIAGGFGFFFLLWLGISLFFVLLVPLGLMGDAFAVAGFFLFCTALTIGITAWMMSPHGEPYSHTLHVSLGRAGGGHSAEGQTTTSLTTEKGAL